MKMFNKKMILFMLPALLCCSSFVTASEWEQLDEKTKTELRPPQSIVYQINAIFSNELIHKISSATPDLKVALENAGFKVVQYADQGDVDTIVIVTHPCLPHYLIKFFPNPKIERIKDKRKFGGKMVVNCSQRVKKSRIVQNIIDEQRYKFVRVPKKFFYSLDNAQDMPVGIAIVESIANDCERTLRKLKEEEISEMLQLVGHARGIISFTPAHIVLTAEHIYYIDTDGPLLERARPRNIKDIALLFDPHLTPLIDAWAEPFKKAEKELKKLERKEDTPVTSTSKDDILDPQLKAELKPSEDIINHVNSLFSGELINKISEATPDLKEALEKSGFKMIQYAYPEDVNSVIVVMHPSLPRYLLKFFPNPKLEHFKEKRKLGGRLDINILQRVKKSRIIQNLIEINHYKFVRVPRKYFHSLDNGIDTVVGVAIVEAIPQGSMRRLHHLTGDEVKEMLQLVEQGKGIIDLKPANFILSDEHIYFIDTEGPILDIVRPRNVKDFQVLINPQLVPMLEAWAEPFKKAEKALKKLAKPKKTDPK